MDHLLRDLSCIVGWYFTPVLLLSVAAVSLLACRLIRSPWPLVVPILMLTLWGGCAAADAMEQAYLERRYGQPAPPAPAAPAGKDFIV